MGRAAGLVGTVVLAVAGCTGGGGMPPSSPSSPSDGASRDGGTPEATVAPSPDPGPTATPRPAHWRVVTFGDSFADPAGWPSQLAERMAADRGLEPDVGGFACFGGCGGTEAERLEARLLREDLGAADVVVVEPQPGFSVEPVWWAITDGTCGGGDGLDCVRRSIADFRVYVDELLDTILAAARPDATVRVILANAHGPRLWDPAEHAMVEWFDLAAVDPAMFAVFVDQYRGIMAEAAESAEARCLPVLDTNVLFTGPDYTGTYPASYTDDSMHPNDEASRIIVDRLLELGDEPRLVGCAPSR